MFFWRYIFPVFFLVGMVVIMGGLMALYVAFGFTGFWIGIGAVILSSAGRRIRLSPSLSR